MQFRDVSSSSDDITPNGTFMKPGGPESIAALNKLVDVSSVAHPALAPEKDELHASSSASGDKNDKVVVSGDNMDSVVDSDMKTHVSEPEATRTVATAKGQPSLMRPPPKVAQPCLQSSLRVANDRSRGPSFAGTFWWKG